MRNDDEQQPPHFPQGPQPPQADSYYPDLTMDMGSSLGYGQSIQHHSISMPQPTESLPRMRRERLQQLREERMRRQQRRIDMPALISRKRQHDPLEPAGNVAVQLSPAPQTAAEPAQGTAEIQRVKVARASSLISGAFLLSSILGLVQTFLFTYIFGRSMSGEAYLQAYLIPNLIFTVIAGGALSSAFIPVFTAYALKDRDEKEAWHIASSALNLSVACMIALSLVAIFLTPVLVPLYSRPDEVGLIVTLTRIMLLQAVVLGSGVIVGAVLNTKQDFTRTALGTVLYNVGLILGLMPGLFMTFHARSNILPDSAVYFATIGVVLGAILQVGVQIPGLAKVNMRYSFVFDWKHAGVLQIARQMVPRVINAVMLSFSTAVDRSLLSLLGAGLINPYIQSFSILLLPVSLFGSSVSTAAFPSLAGYAAKQRYERVRSIIMETLRGILFLTIPSGVGLVVLSFPITQALLEHGNFDIIATRLASTVLLFFALGLPGLAAVEILTRSFYALQDSKTPVTISVAQFILKIALSIILINLAVFGVQWGMGALAFSTSIAGTIEALVLFFLLSQRIGGFDLHPLLNFFKQALLASGAMAGVVLGMRFILDHMIDTTSMPKLFIHGILMALLKLLIELVAGAAAFLIVARLLKMEEMNSGLVRRVIQLLRLPWL
ncbi:MAG: murein biosynthesis integral membrane protein MurJ [Chloroflexota bacterium]|nr:murein biosynthesis integral membrane protein MurJ [Chloroflexota bacterium]